MLNRVQSPTQLPVDMLNVVALVPVRLVLNARKALLFTLYKFVGAPQAPSTLGSECQGK